MQKAKSLELSLTMLEGYIKETNQRKGDIMPKLEEELSGISLLVETTRTEIRDLMEWKENTVLIDFQNIQRVNFCDFLTIGLVFIIRIKCSWSTSHGKPVSHLVWIRWSEKIQG
jgi:hypothetical protein